MVEYSNIYKLFYNRITNDVDFFIYANITESEAQEIAEQRSKDLLITSINKLYEYGSPNIDFYNKDDDLEVFNEDITVKEQELMSNIMYIKYLELDIIKLKIQDEYFSSKDVKLLNPTQERNSFMNMYKDREKSMEKSIKSYYSRDRNTNEYKSLDYSSFYSS